MTRLSSREPGVLPPAGAGITDASIAAFASRGPSNREMPPSTVIDGFAGLSSEDLARVLNSAGEFTRVDIEKLDRSTWKTLEKAKRLNRHPPEDLLRRMADMVGRNTQLARYVWRDWWGRRLEALLSDKGARELVRSWRLHQRFENAVRAFKDDDAFFVSFFTATLPGLRASEAFLDRMFAAMADARIASDDLVQSEEQACSNPSEPGDPNAVTRAPLESAPTSPGTATEEAYVTLSPQRAAEGTPEPSLAPSEPELLEPSAPTIDEISAPTTLFSPSVEQYAADEAASTGVVRLTELLQRCVAISHDAMASFSRGLFQPAAERMNQAAELKAEVVTHYATLRPELRPELAQIPGEVFIDETATSQFVTLVRQNIEENRRLARARVEESRAALQQQFSEARLTPPPELTAANSIAQLDALRDAWSESLRAEAAYLALVARRPDARQQFATLPARTRMLHYARVAQEEGRPLKPEEQLSLLTDDSEAVHSDVAQAEMLFAQLASLILEEERPLPPTTWSFATAIASGNVTRLLLTNERLLDSLRLVDPSLWHPELLLTAIGNDRDKLPPDLRRTLERVAIRNAPADQRIALNARLALDDLSDRDALTSLLQALIESERDREALLLALAAYRSGVADLPNGPFFDSLLVSLVSSAVDAPRWHSTLADMVGDGDWMIGSLEGVTVLMFLCHVLGLPHAYDHLRYARLEQLEKAASVRPILVGRWLTARLAGSPDAPANQAEVLERARQAIEKWDHEIAKPSAYSPWVPAEEYQDVFRERLQQSFAVVDAGGAVPAFTAEDLIQEGVGRGIKAAEEPALGHMNRYVNQQLDRLQLLFNARALLGGPLREGLRRRHVPLRDQLIKEARLPQNTHRALSLIYVQAIGVEQ